MRERIVNLHLNHFRIDHDETQFLRREAEEHARDQRIDADALTAAGGAGHEQVRHLGEISDDCFAVNIFPEREWNFRASFRLLPVGRLQKFAQRYGHFTRVRQLDTDGVFAWNRGEDVDPLGARGASKVAFETYDFVHPHAFGRINFVARDRRAFGDVAGCDCDAKLRECLDQNLLDALELGRIRGRAAFRIMFVQ